MLYAQSAVWSACYCGVTNNLLKNSFIFIETTRKMSNWEAEKQKYLNLNQEERHSMLRNYKILSTIPTWTQYFKDKQPLPKKIDILGGFEIDSSKNKDLANKVSIFNGDITSLEIDAIVNAANTSLLGGGGVDGAIHRAAGPNLKAECATLRGCKTGEAKITGGYKLPAKYVIHTVGPQKEKPDLLTMCYKNSLDIMLQNNLRTIAFPCVSTGIYGYPIDKAVHVSNRQVREFLEKNHGQVDRVVFCLFGPEDVDIYERALQSYFPVE